MPSCEATLPAGHKQERACRVRFLCLMRVHDCIQALQRLQQQQKKMNAEQQQEAKRLQAWQADLATRSAELQVSLLELDR